MTGLKTTPREVVAGYLADVARLDAQVQEQRGRGRTKSANALAQSAEDSFGEARLTAINSGDTVALAMVEVADVRRQSHPRTGCPPPRRPSASRTSSRSSSRSRREARPLPDVRRAAAGDGRPDRPSRAGGERERRDGRGRTTPRVAARGGGRVSRDGRLREL